MSQVTPLESVPSPDPGAPLPALFQSETQCAFAYRSAAAWRGKTVVLRFDGCLSAQFGYPNDEALAGHLLWSQGLDYYGCFEVGDSPWLQELRAQNRVHSADSESWGADLRHFVIAMHDSTFECLATGVSSSLSEESPRDPVAATLA